MKKLDEYLVNHHLTQEKQQDNVYIENYDDKGNLIVEDNAMNEMEERKEIENDK